MLQLYEFSVLRFYRLFLLTLQSIDTLRLYEFTILRLYHLLLSTLSTKKHKFTNLRFCCGFLRFHMSSTILPFNGFTPSRPFPACALHTEHEFTKLLFYFDSLRLHTRFTILCLCTVPLLGLLFNFQTFSTVDATP